jgi:hypothetical protein
MEALSRGAHVVSFCKPMKEEIQHWHIVTSAEEMKQKALSILRNETNYEPVAPYSMNDTISKLMELFNAEK